LAVARRALRVCNEEPTCLRPIDIHRVAKDLALQHDVVGMGASKSNFQRVAARPNAQVVIRKAPLDHPETANWKSANTYRRSMDCVPLL
jgi:hypothetical protein